MSAGKELVWLHLSDIHFHPKTEWRDSHIRKELLDFLRDGFQDGSLPRPHLVFCTGDIAFGETSGAPLKQQYAEAVSFFGQLLDCCGLPRERLFMVPGNHDVNRREISGDQQTRLVEMAGDPRKHVAAVNQRFEDASKDHRSAMERLQDYGNFVQSYRPELHKDDYHLYAHKLDVEGWQVGVAGFNSAWSCAGPEDDRHVWLAGEWQFNHMARELDGAELKIGLIHHPFDWLNEAERHEAEQRASKDLHFLLHGHTHTAWVRPSENCVQLAAGATGADTPDEFGINLTQLNPVTGECCTHLYTYRQGWVIAPVAKHAPAGQWRFNSSLRLQESATPAPSATVAETEQLPAVVPVPGSPEQTKGLFGRDSLLKLLSRTLQEKPALALHGLSGCGKTTLIKALHELPAFSGMTLVSIHCSRHMTAGELFRYFMNVLHEKWEDPQPPAGTLQEQIDKLAQRYPDAESAYVWLNNAHLLLQSDQWRQPEIRSLLQALQAAFPGWKWLYELNDKPADDSFGRHCPMLEVPGLDWRGLVDFLAASAPQGQEAEWRYSRNNVQGLFQWLGGGQGGTAHTQAAELLVMVACEKGVTPLVVYERLRDEYIEHVGEKLLSVLHKESLGEAERRLLKALALYRSTIPQDHADRLEDALGAVGAWSNLRRRGLLPLDNASEHYLHGFIASWVRKTQLQLGSVELDSDYSIELPAELKSMHLLIGQCWQRQIGRQREALNFQRANEALYHLLCADDLGEVEACISHLEGSGTGWSLEGLWALYHRRRDDDVSVARQQEVLQLLVNMHPREPKAWRFLGECQQQTQGKGCDAALESFERALELYPQFPPYLANLGKALRARGKEGAEEFLRRLAGHREQYSQAIDDFVLSIEADCLEGTGQTEAASRQRLEQIESGNKNPAFYNDEASYQLTIKKDPSEALRILDLVARNQCGNDHTDAIRGKVLEAMGDGLAASALRWKRISAGDPNPVFYNDEVNYQVEQLNDPEKALELLDLVEQRGIANAVTRAMRRKAENWRQQAG